MRMKVWTQTPNHFIRRTSNLLRERGQRVDGLLNGRFDGKSVTFDCISLEQFWALGDMAMTMELEYDGRQQSGLEIGALVQIRAPYRGWEDAEIVGVGMDALDGTREVFVVQQRYFGEIQFYRQSDSQGRHYQPGNAALWMVPAREEQE
jgi:hypothetical protein